MVSFKLNFHSSNALLQLLISRTKVYMESERQDAHYLRVKFSRLSSQNEGNKLNAKTDIKFVSYPQILLQI